MKNDVDRVGDISNRKLILSLGGKHGYSTHSLWNFQWHFKIHFSTIISLTVFKFSTSTRFALQFQNSEQICLRLIDQEITRLLRVMILMHSKALQNNCDRFPVHLIVRTMSIRPVRNLRRISVEKRNKSQLDWLRKCFQSIEHYIGLTRSYNC